MATTNIDLSVDMLKKSLAANGLPQYQNMHASGAPRFPVFVRMRPEE
jgi:hypothetical protein